MSLNKFFPLIHSAIFLMVFSACNGQYNGNQSNKKEELIEICYTIEPVYNDSKSDTLGNFHFGREGLNIFLDRVVKTGNEYGYDSTMDCITNFSYQKVIVVNSNCLNKLQSPNSSNLLYLYFNSAYSTWIKNSSSVKFIRTYNRVILNFGTAQIYEYKFDNVAEIEPHFMYIILKDQSEEDKRYARDSHGLVIYSDGLDWKDYIKNGFSIPIYARTIKGNAQIYIPLYYEKGRFIPIGHFSSDN